MHSSLPFPSLPSLAVQDIKSAKYLGNMDTEQAFGLK